VKGVDRLAWIVVVVATAWLGFTALWGMGAIPGGGHTGAGNAGTFMAAEQMVRWHSLYPGRSWYTGIRPEGAALMCHHPYGQYYVPAILFLLFGHHDALIHLPAVLLSTAIPPLLYAITKERWGAPIGAVAAAGYVVVPIAVGFSSYWNLETICIFGSLLFFWGHSRHLATGRGRYLAASLAGLCVVVSGDWVGYLLVAPTMAWAFLRAFVFPARLTPRFRPGPYARWWAFGVVIMAASLLWWIGLFAHAEQIPQWLGAEDSRGGGGLGTLREALQSRKAWIDFSFTPLAIVLGKIAAPLCVIRLLVVRRDEETYALGILFGAVVQYVAFRKGADVHIYWPHYFAAYFALALAQLAGTLGVAVAWIVRRIRPTGMTRVQLAGALGLAIGLLPVVAMTHDALRSLGVWRRTGGRYDEHGSLMRSHVDLLFVMQEVILPKTRRGMSIDAHKTVQWGWEFQWKSQAVGNAADAPAVGATDVGSHPFWIARASGLTGDEQRKIAASAHVRIYGDAWVVDQREPAAPVDAYSLNEREPNALEWLFYGGTEPMRSIGEDPDPWLTWEWRTHLGQPAVLPTGTPRTPDEMRIAHNLAVATGDQAGAARWLQAIEEPLDRTPATSFTSGLRLLGVRVTGGVQPRVESWFEAGGDAPLGDASFDVRSTVEARDPWSLIPPDPTDREMAYPPRIPTKLWRPGFVYMTDAVLNHRIGKERYWGHWRSRGGSGAPSRVDGQPQTTLVTLP
jgi:4-amino-4-deoxy-L-arabinose transferase-like glycosyltransferase